MLGGNSVATSCAALTVTSVRLFLKTGRLTRAWCKSQVCLKGKTAIVTGANTGIGYETALDFAKRGARVILACRDETRAREACNHIKEETNNDDVVYRLVNLASFESVRKFVQDVKNTETRLDILVNNAGAYGLGNKKTEDEIPMVMQINYFSHFLLTNLLLDLLKKTPSSRIVNVSGTVAMMGRVDLQNLTGYTCDDSQYCNTKLCQILFTVELAKRLQNTNVTCYSVHPGLINSGLFRNTEAMKRMSWLSFLDIYYKTAAEGAQTQIYCAVENGLEQHSGQHFHDCKLVPRYGNARNPRIAQALWEKSEKLVGLKN